MSRARRSAPPRLVARILHLCAVAEARPAVLGDLEEEFHWLSDREGHAHAERWYRSQALRSTIPLLAWKLRTQPGARAASGVVVGAATAIATATLVGSSLQALVGTLVGTHAGTGDNAGLPLIAAVVVGCAFVSSACAARTSLWATGRRSPWVLFAVGAVVVAPELVHSVLHSHADAWPRALAPLALAIAAASLGLRFGGRPQPRSTHEGDPA